MKTVLPFNVSLEVASLGGFPAVVPAPVGPPTVQELDIIC